MFGRLEEIKKLRKARKLVAEKKLSILETNYKFKNKNPKIENVKCEINQLEKDLQNLANLEKKFKQKNN